MLLITLLLPAWNAALLSAAPAPASDPNLYDLSYAASEPVAALSYAPQDDDWDDRPAYHTHRAWYFGIHGGFASTETSNDDVDVDFDDGLMLGAAVGYHFGPRIPQEHSWAAELELLWSDQDVDAEGAGPISFNANSDVTVLAVMMNGIFNYFFTERWGAYGGAGLGLGWLDFGDVVDGPLDFEDESGPFFSWQLKAGLQAMLGERTTLRFGYRFLNIDEAELDENASDASFDVATRQHVIELGLLWGF